MRALNYLLAMAAAGAMLAGCEKDDVIVDGPEPEPSSTYRPATLDSSPYCSRVFDYTPAPGQFIGETVTGGMTGNETTPALAAQWAEERLANGSFVSLGSFGGYIVVGFDHSITNSGGSYDFAIVGNAYVSAQGGSNEPGIVYVMQDANGNGLPDDTWYELRGSETGKADVRRDYSVTYYRPTADASPVEWVDSDGNRGTVDYIAFIHKQPSYYPQWIDAASYTLSGTLLPARNTEDAATGFWNNAPYGWGYADNFGSDILDPAAKDAAARTNGFAIANAIDAAGAAVDLKYIDFVKVQTGVLAKSGHLGEVSTEVFGVYDYHLLQ